MSDNKTLRKAISSYQYVVNPYNLANIASTQKFGDASYSLGASPYVATNGFSRLSYAPTNYSEELYQCRFFYRTDPTASTVVNRMAELAGSKVHNRRLNCTDEEFFYFESLSRRLTALVQQCALEYLVAGMSIPDYGQKKVMGNKLDPSLGRKRYIIPDKMWSRNPENIILKRTPFGPDRRVYLRIPPEERSFILNEGKYSDGTEDQELYNMLVKEFPEYVKAIRDGKTQILLPNSRPILRKPQPNSDYPQPFLVPALSAMKHKLRIKEMDHSLATKAIEAIMLIRAGNDEFPLTEDDDELDNLRTQMKAKDADMSNQAFYRLYANHTVTVDFVIPPLEALLSSTKYEAVDADIFMAMGFSRVLLVGESAKSNAGAGPTIILGPMAMLEEVRTKLVEWISGLYEEMAEINNFTNIPEPYFDSLVQANVDSLVTNAANALKAGVISKNTYANLYGKDFETEQRQIELETETVAASPTFDARVQMGQQPNTAPTPEPQDETGPDGTTKPAPKPQMPSDTLNI